MKHAFQVFLLKYKLFVLVVLKPLGIWGAGIIAFIDGSAIPVPMDILIGGFIYSDQSRFLLYCLLVSLGSALGSLVPFYVGRAGGELFLLKHVNRERFEQLRDRFEKQEFFAILIPAMLPPPTPFKLFDFAAGVFEMKVLNFLLAVFLGRLVHFLILSWLVIQYGPQILQVIVGMAHQHLTAMLIGIGVLVALLVVWVVRKQRKRRNAAA